MTLLIRNGRNKYPGANFVIRNRDITNGIKIDLRYAKSMIKLNIGDIVERHLLDGDPVLFNR